MDLSTTWLGLPLKHPLIASSSPLTGDLDSLKRLEDAGAAAVILPTIFEEQIDQEGAEYERWTGVGADSTPEMSSYFPTPAATGPNRYLDLINRSRAALNIPVVASLNGITPRGWTEYASLIQQAGASALELNTFFVPIDAALNGPTVEQRHLQILREVKAAVTLPVTVKLSPYFSAPADMVRQLDRAGANGVSLFNRFYQPDIDLLTMRLRRDLDLSTPTELRLPLLWISVLSGQIKASIAATTGVETADQVIKYVLAGADTVMTASALLRHGPNHMRTLLTGLTQWLEAREVPNLADIRGRMSRHRLGDPTAFERANYITILQGWPTTQSHA